MTNLFFSYLNRFVFVLCICLSACSSEEPNKKTIAITQIVTHPALDKIRQGILDALKEEGFNDQNTTIIFDNAHGNPSTAAQIAQKFKGQNPNIVIGITTPSAQALANTFQHSQTPVVFAAVTDPENAHLSPNQLRGKVHLTGTTDFPPVQKQVELLQKLLPQAQKVGILYATSEINARKQVEAFRRALGGEKELIEIPITTPAEILVALKSKIQKIDALHIPLDNTVVANIKPVIHLANAQKVPVFTSHPEGVLEEGAFASVSIDQYQSGHETGLIAARVLRGQAPEAIPVKRLQDSQTYINHETAQTFGISIPQEA